MHRGEKQTYTGVVRKHTLCGPCLLCGPYQPSNMMFASPRLKEVAGGGGYSQACKLHIRAV